MLFCEACAIGSYISCNIFVELDERSLKIFEIQSLILEGWQTTKEKWKFLKKHRVWVYYLYNFLIQWYRKISNDLFEDETSSSLCLDQYTTKYYFIRINACGALLKKERNTVPNCSNNLALTIRIYRSTLQWKSRQCGWLIKRKNVSKEEETDFEKKRRFHRLFRIRIITTTNYTVLFQVSVLSFTLFCISFVVLFPCFNFLFLFFF